MGVREQLFKFNIKSVLTTLSLSLPVPDILSVFVSTEGKILLLLWVATDPFPVTGPKAVAMAGHIFLVFTQPNVKVSQQVF